MQVRKISRFLILGMMLIVFTKCSSITRSSAYTEENSASNSQTNDSVNAGMTSSSPTETVTQQKTEASSGIKPTSLKDKSPEASAEYHFSMANAYVAEGNPDRAIEEFKATLMYDPNSALVHTRLAAEYVKKGMLSAAMESCKDALKADAKFVDARLMLAGLYSTTKETTSAIREYDQILKDHPKHEEAAVYKAQTLMDDGKVAEALKGLKIFAKKNPQSALGWYYVGRAEQLLDHFAPAVTAYRKAWDLHKGFNQAALALGYLYESQKQHDRAIATYIELYDKTQNLSAANRLSTLYLKMEKYKDAIPYLEAIQLQDPTDMNAQVKLGLVHMQLKNYPKSTEIFSKILEKNPESDRVRYYLANIHEETKNYPVAVEEFKKIGADSTLYEDATLHATYLTKLQGKNDEAREYISQATKKPASFASFFVFLANLEEERKDYSKAIEALERGVERYPDDEKIRYYLGSLYDRQGQVARAMAQMEAILDINSNNVDALNYMGYTWTTQGIRLDDAEAYLKKALSLKPDNGYIQDSWGWHLFVRGRVKEAVVQLEKAVKLKPTEPTILEHLGDAYVKNNLREKALFQYAEAMKLMEDDSTKKTLASKIQNLQEEIMRAQVDSNPAQNARSPAATEQSKAAESQPTP